MKTLYLLRHAKSSWSDAGLADHERPLTHRGEEAAGRIAGHLRSAAVRPGLVLCSTARRARDTLTLLRPALGDGVPAVETDDLYGAAAGDVLDLVRGLDAGVDSVMVVGHNPGLQDLAVALAGDGDEAALGQLRTKFPTAALATLTADMTAWEHLGPGRAYLASLVLPRQLR